MVVILVFLQVVINLYFRSEAASLLQSIIIQSINQKLHFWLISIYAQGFLSNVSLYSDCGSLLTLDYRRAFSRVKNLKWNQKCNKNIHKLEEN